MGIRGAKLEDLIARGKRRARAPMVVRIQARILLHTKDGDEPRETPCPCCGSRIAYIVEEKELDEFLISANGDRRIRSELEDNPARLAAFDEVAARYKPIDLPIRLPVTNPEKAVGSEDVVLDFGPKVWALGGGQRASKTHTNCYAFVVRWLYRGGMGADFGLFAPQIDLCHKIGKKLWKGENEPGNENPPILPAELIRRVPTRLREDDQFIELFDGSRLLYYHTKSDRHINGMGLVDAFWSEAAQTSDAEVFGVIVSRMTGSGGQLIIDSTPAKNVRDHWLRTTVVDPALEAESKRRNGEKVEGVEARIAELSGYDNAWVRKGEIDKLRALYEAQHPVMARRLIDGEWVAADTIFGDIYSSKTHGVDCGGDLSLLGLRDITRDVTRRIFGKATDWIAGADVNRNPHTVVVCKVFGTDPRNNKTWGLYIHRDIRTRGYTDESARRCTTVEGGRYRGMSIVIDANAAFHNDAHNRTTASNSKQDYEAEGFRVRHTQSREERKPQQAPLRVSQSWVRMLMRSSSGVAIPGDSAEFPRLLVSSQASSGVGHAFEVQPDSGDGTPHKEPGTAMDRKVHCRVEAVRYLVYMLFNYRFRGSATVSPL